MNKCPHCGGQLDDKGTCTTSGPNFVCYYGKDPNGEHWLVVTNKIDPETDKLAWEIEHPDSCPLVDYDGQYQDYACSAREAMFEGYADGAKALETPGRYLIEPWGEKSWTDYGWEHDGGVYLIPEAEVRAAAPGQRKGEKQQ